MPEEDFSLFLCYDKARHETEVPVVWLYFECGGIL